MYKIKCESLKRNHGDFWVLKCDIRKFFYSIDPYILFNIMKKYISDKALLDFTKLLILMVGKQMIQLVFQLATIQVNFLLTFT